MAKNFLILVIFIFFINPIFPEQFVGPKYLHIYDDTSELQKPILIKNTDYELTELINNRYRRDLTAMDRNESLKNITTKVH